MSDIVVKDISKAFSGKAVLSSFSATFKEGEFTSVMGPSGCGKTTLAGIIMGLVKPDSGKITGVPSKISAVFQENRLCGEFNAVSNVQLVTGRRFSREQITECLNDLGLEGSLDKPVDKLSGGMKRRVALARAIIADYDLLILDEPFKELDEKTKLLVMEYVKQATYLKTVILITHSKEEAEFFGGPVIQMPPVSSK